MDTTLFDVLDRTYSKACLVSLFLTYFGDWSRNGWVSSRIPADGKTTVAGKGDYLQILRRFYTDAELFQKVYQQCLPAVQQAFCDAAWYGAADIVKLEQAYKLEIATRKAPGGCYTPSEMHRVLTPEFRFFRYEGSYYDYHYSYKDKGPFSGQLVLPDELRKPLRTLLPKPKNYSLHPVEQLADTHRRTTQEGAINQLELCYTYVTEGNIAMTAKGDRMTAKSLRLMKSYCRVTEFFSEPDIDSVATELLASFLQTAVQNIGQQGYYTFGSLPELLQRLLEDFFENTQRYKLCSMLLPYIKGYFVERPVGVTFRALLRTLPTDNSWVDINNCIDYVTFHDLDFDLIEKQRLYREAYVSIRGSWSAEREYISTYNYQRYITTPLIQGLFFLAAAFGIVDIAYDTPEKKKDDIITRTPYLTPWSGLCAVRLTPLGRFIVGIDQHFEGSLTSDTGKVLLDEYTLIAIIDGESKILRLALDKMGTPLDESRYEITPASLFKECKTTADIERKISLFTKSVAQPLPTHWERFFSDAVANTNPLTQEKDHIVLKLRPDNQLISIVGSNPALKKYILKAEDYHIVIKRKDLPTVRQLLSQYGYFSEQ